MKLFKKREKPAFPAVQTAVRGAESRQAYPVALYSYELFERVRRAVPLVDAAISKLVRLIGSFTVECADSAFQKSLDRFLREVPVAYRDRPQGSVSKLNTFSDGISVLKTIVLLYKEYRPLRFFSWLAAFLTLAGVLLLIPVLVEYFHTGLVPRFPTLIVSMFLLLAALLSLFTGLCLDVIVTKDRKNYELRLLQGGSQEY